MSAWRQRRSVDRGLDSGPARGKAAVTVDTKMDSPSEAPASGDKGFLVAAFYKFVALDDLEEWTHRLKSWAVSGNVRGTVLIAQEGINGTICGPEAGVRTFLGELRSHRYFADLGAKLSWSQAQGFNRFKARIKREIVTMGCPQVNPREVVGTYVAPRDWDALIRDPETLVVDTRNNFEFELGTFERAVDPLTKSFGEFPAWVESTLRPLIDEQKPKRIALFCTGGIRCEKATSFLLQAGFEGVHHLQGGILQYLEDVEPGQGSFHGECFVFDQRVAVNEHLAPGTAVMCHACRMPLQPSDLELPSYVEGVSCRHCVLMHTDERREGFAERERQVALAASRGEDHLAQVFSGAKTKTAPSAQPATTPIAAG